jgi:hypothetical protein
MARLMTEMDLAVAICKEATDILFSLGVVDQISAESRLRELRRLVDTLEHRLTEERRS